VVRVGQPYTSGSWTVRDGGQDEFVARWIKFVRTAADDSPGAESFTLIQDREDPRRFVSFGAWRDWDSVDAWRGSTTFAENMRACRELCDDFRPGDATLKAFEKPQG
jgi:heme-degrading monooxygenase HmoA